MILTVTITIMIVIIMVIVKIMIGAAAPARGGPSVRHSQSTPDLHPGSSAAPETAGARGGGTSDKTSLSIYIYIYI